MRAVNIVPPPVQRPIPIWLGGVSEAVIKRAARLADGWMLIIRPDEIAEQKLALLRDELEHNGRDPSRFGLEAWLRMRENDPQKWATAAAAWGKLGAGMVMLYPMFRTPDFAGQIDILRRFKDVASAS